MHINKELLGLRLEIAGLVTVLLATVWQGSFTDWFDRNNRNWIAYTQETVNFATLRALNDISKQVGLADPEAQRKLRDEVSDTVHQAYLKAIDERDQRLALQHGQASVFGSIRYAMVLVGAALVIFGKWLVLRHKSTSRP